MSRTAIWSPKMERQTVYIAIPVVVLSGLAIMGLIRASVMILLLFAG